MVQLFRNMLIESSENSNPQILNADHNWRTLTIIWFLLVCAGRVGLPKVVVEWENDTVCHRVQSIYNHDKWG